MPEVDLGNVMGPQGVPGSQWYYGTKITGTSTTGTVFSSSGISSARVNDKYLNTSTGNIYNCTTAGAASVAKWAYIGNIKGPQGNVGPAGPTGEVDFTTPITFSVPSSRSNLASGDSIATLFGKTQKWFNDINSGGASTLLANNLSVNRALISNASGKIAVSTITSTELGYLDGVTSNIQGQIGTLSSLDTSAKGSLVAAVNELNGKIPIIQSGTKSLDLGLSGATHWGVFANYDINQLLGVTNASNFNTSVFFSNGDYAANSFVVDAYYDSGTWYAKFDKSIVGSIRLNYIVAYNPG